MPLTPEAQAALLAVPDEAWLDLIFRMVKRADRILRRRTSRGVYGLPHVGGKSADDFAMAAFEALRSGRRTFDPKAKTVEAALFEALESEISNALTSSENQTREWPADYDAAGRSAPRDGVTIRDILRFLEDDSDLRQIVLAISEGYDKPREIAEYLALDVKEVINRQRRLRRRLERAGFAPEDFR